MIGLGKQADKNWTSIHGDRDVALMRPVLQRCGFKDIQVLINHNATKKAIVEAFVRLEKSCKSGDWVYVHFSGHGQLMSDREGDEKDGWDECWIPYDAYMCYGTNDDGRFHLTDDEVNRMLMSVRLKVGSQGKILVVVDACHSGDSTRGGEDEVYRGVSDKFLLPQKKPIIFVRRNEEHWLTLSACRDYQRNAELKTSQGYYGKLTVALCQILREQKPMTNSLLYKRIVSFFNQHRGALPQTPVLSGDLETFRITDMFQ